MWNELYYWHLSLSICLYAAEQCACVWPGGRDRVCSAGKAWFHGERMALYPVSPRVWYQLSSEAGNGLTVSSWQAIALTKDDNPIYVRPILCIDVSVNEMIFTNWLEYPFYYSHKRLIISTLYFQKLIRELVTQMHPFQASKVFSFLCNSACPQDCVDDQYLINVFHTSFSNSYLAQVVHRYGENENYWRKNLVKIIVYYPDLMEEVSIYLTNNDFRSCIIANYDHI